ncbi:MAG TPA: FHA domain-containing protein [Actinomycetota bacterium]|nr:FHA domain-containing protein [Actinomycetota bacterium]
MPPFVLTVLKVVFLALLYFFIWRAVRSVTADLRGRKAAAPAPRTRPEAVRQSARAKPPKLLVVLNEKGGKIASHQLDGDQLQIGRAEACQVHVDDTYASQFHARIYRRDGSWYIEDLGSTNGTYLNQRRITSPAELRAGDRLRVGKTSMELRR